MSQFELLGLYRSASAQVLCAGMSARTRHMCRISLSPHVPSVDTNVPREPYYQFRRIDRLLGQDHRSPKGQSQLQGIRGGVRRQQTPDPPNCASQDYLTLFTFLHQAATLQRTVWKDTKSYLPTPHAQGHLERGLGLERKSESTHAEVSPRFSTRRCM